MSNYKMTDAQYSCMVARINKIVDTFEQLLKDSLELEEVLKILDLPDVYRNPIKMGLMPYGPKSGYQIFRDYLLRELKK